MVLHQSNFEIPARFSFQPFIAEWFFAVAETVEWTDAPTLKMAFQPDGDSEKNWLMIRIEVPETEFSTRLMLGFEPVFQTVLMDRSSVPPDVLQAHENHRNTPDISGRSFRMLICRKPEFKDRIWDLTPGKPTKNAWLMRDEFLNLTSDSELDWGQSARRFLNKWGLWSIGRGYERAWTAHYPMLAKLATAGTRELVDTPDFTIVMPHLLKAHQERYRRALMPSKARNWLSLHPLHLSTAGKFPFFRVNKSYCSEAIEATITIDHLGEKRFGICKRCHKVFEKETNHEKNYCSKPCINAASVQRWREKQRNAAKKGAKRNAKG